MLNSQTGWNLACELYLQIRAVEMKAWLINRRKEFASCFVFDIEQHLFLHCHIHTFIINLRALAVRLRMRLRKPKTQLFPFFPKAWERAVEACEAQILCGMSDTSEVPVDFCHRIEFSGLCLAFTGK